MRLLAMLCQRKIPVHFGLVSSGLTSVGEIGGKTPTVALVMGKNNRFSSHLCAPTLAFAFKNQHNTLPHKTITAGTERAVRCDVEQKVAENNLFGIHLF